MAVYENSTGLQAGVFARQKADSSRLQNNNNAFVNLSKSRLEAGFPELRSPSVWICNPHGLFCGFVIRFTETYFLKTSFLNKKSFSDSGLQIQGK